MWMCYLQDKRITFDEWREGDLKASTPFGQLPVLEVDGKTIAQSAAIRAYPAAMQRLAACTCQAVTLSLHLHLPLPFPSLPDLHTDRYCAHLAGMMPSDPLEAAIADQVYFFCEEDLWRVR